MAHEDLTDDYKFGLGISGKQRNVYLRARLNDQCQCYIWTIKIP